MDDFCRLSHWQPVTSGLLQLKLDEHDDALRLRFAFDACGGFVVARRLLDLPLPQRCRLHLRVRGEGPSNRVELKLVDRSGQNVWWYRRHGVQWTKGWEDWQIESHDIEFAWGPAGGGRPQDITAVELAVVGENAGDCTVWVGGLQVEDLSAREQIHLHSDTCSPGASLALPWQGGASSWLLADLQEPRAWAALVLDWHTGSVANAFRIERSDDGQHFETIRELTGVASSRCDIFLGPQCSRYIRVSLLRGAANNDVAILQALDIVSLERARTQVEFLHDIAQRRERGLLPRYFSREQCLWTVIGAPDSPTQALISQDGAVEIHKPGFSLEPFVFEGEQILNWATGEHLPYLPEGFLPVPVVSRRHDALTLETSAVCIQLAKRWCVLVRYRLVSDANAGCERQLRLVMAARPFQVTPPWQAWRDLGGMAQLHEVSWEGPDLHLNQRWQVLPVQTPDQCAAHAWLGAEPARGLCAEAAMPVHAKDDDGLAQASCCWNIALAPGTEKSRYVLVPFDDLDTRQNVEMRTALKNAAVDQLFAQAADAWRNALADVQITLPEQARAFADTLKTATAHILINRDGVAIQPGPRRYARAWIRDAATMGAALLRMGFAQDVRAFLYWYRDFLREDGYVPCCVDTQGADPLVEHDSHGQWLYILMEYFRFTGDFAFLKDMRDSACRTVDFLLRLRATRLGPDFEEDSGNPRRGLIPESVSHEGYMAQPVHAYWDSFWALRGLEDVAEMFAILGEKTQGQRYKEEALGLRASIVSSMQNVMSGRNIAHIPGSVEWADFDPSASACAVGQLGFADMFPVAALQHTFDTFMAGWRERTQEGAARQKYSAYDIRCINALVRIGRREDAFTMARFYLDERRPKGWNQWPEITWPDPKSPGHLGDLPHSWIGAEFVLAMRSMLAEEQGDALVIGAGLPAEWLDGNGVRVARLPTAFGDLGFHVCRDSAGNITIALQGALEPPAGIVLELPLCSDIRRVDGADSNLLSCTGRRVVLRQSPATVRIVIQEGSEAVS